jgi:type IV secretion system protein VirD4
MNYGLRYSIALLIGIPLAALWMWLFAPSPPFFSFLDFRFVNETRGFLRILFFIFSPDLIKQSYIVAYAPHLAILCAFVANQLQSFIDIQSLIYRKFEFARNDAWSRRVDFFLLGLSLITTFFGLAAVSALILAAGQNIISGADGGKIFWGFVWFYLVALFIPLLLLTAPPGYIFLKEIISTHPRYRRWFSFSKGGSARWAGYRVYRNHISSIFDGRPYAEGYSSTGIYLGKTLFEDTFKSDHVEIFDDAHMLTIGCTGSGKSATCLWANMATYAGSMFIIDPKGEHARMTYHRRNGKRHISESHPPKNTKYFLDYGQAFILDPFGSVPDLPSVRYNPLSDIDINSDRVRGILSAISQACVLPESPKAQHFVENAALLLEGVIAHVLSTHPKEHHNLPYVCDLLIGFDPEIGVADPDKFNELLIEMRMNDVAGKIAQLAASKISEMGDNERGSVLSTLSRSVKWITDPAMRKHLAESDFSMKVLQEKYDTTTVYVVLPFDYMESQSRWLRTLTSLSLGLIQTAPEPPKRPIVYVLDEFPMMGGKLKKIEEGIVTLRSAGVKLWVIVQSISQLKHHYGENWETFVSSSTVQLFGVKDLETAKWASEYLGKAVIQRKEKTGRFSSRVVSEKESDLATPPEIMEELGKSKPFQYVFPMGGQPMRLHRLAYKPIEIDRIPFKGLPLEGHFEQ